METPTLYLDTSVIGGYFDDEFKTATRELFRQANLGIYRIFVSVVTANEIQNAPLNVRGFFAETFDDGQILPLTTKAEVLAQAYLAANVVTIKYTDDARHVAIATVEEMELIVSWNFKHLANYQKEKAFNGVNHLQGYRDTRILTPLELIYGDKEKI